MSNAYDFPQVGYTLGETSAAATDTLRFENAGNDTTNDNLIARGCVGTGFTIGQDIGSEGGETTCTINWATGYMPSYDNAALASTPIEDSGNPDNIRTLSLSSTSLGAGSSNPLIQSWELTCSRTIERVHYGDITSGTFNPLGYAMTGGFEITGSITVVRNKTVYDLLANMYNSTAVDLNIAGSSLTVALDKVYINEPTIDNGGAFLTQTIPFTVVGVDDTCLLYTTPSPRAGGVGRMPGGG